MKQNLKSLLLTFIIAVMLCAMPVAAMAEEAEAPEALGKTFIDLLDQKDSDRWYASNGWSNGGTFLSGWRDDHVIFEDGKLKLLIDDKPCAQDKAQCSDKPYASGEYSTTQRYGYGKFEVRMKAVKGDGVVTGFFTYGADSDGKADEIDIEILGKNTTQFETNYFTKGVGMHSTIIPLGFDAADDFHDYAFEWAPDSIKWYVDGKLVHTETGSRGELPSAPGYIIANMWPATKTNGWANEYVYPGKTQIAEVDRIAYTLPKQQPETNVDPSTPVKQGKSVDLLVEDARELKVFKIGQTEMAPLRFVMESLYATVKWNAAKQEIIVNDKLSKSEMIFKVNSNVAFINGIKTMMKNPVILNNGHAYVPLLVLTDAIGADVIRKDGKVSISRGNE
ncbi:family 16 glycosylhydrolase [Paenibacillus sp. 2TAB26]|uniref:family 16 glycosylhydrolase n=1 Tax=Paenibacillus sp. 2TAB26 TaxID=3233005 RepID=UPI003F9C7711